MTPEQQQQQRQMLMYQYQQQAQYMSQGQVSLQTFQQQQVAKMQWAAHQQMSGGYASPPQLMTSQSGLSASVGRGMQNMASVVGGQVAQGAAHPAGAMGGGFVGRQKIKRPENTQNIEKAVLVIVHYHLGVQAPAEFVELLVEKYCQRFPIGAEVDSTAPSSSSAQLVGRKKLVNASISKVAKKTEAPDTKAKSSEGSSSSMTENIPAPPRDGAATADTCDDTPQGGRVEKEENTESASPSKETTDENPSAEDELLYARMCDVLARYVQETMRAMDQWVPAYTEQRQHGVHHVVQKREHCYYFFFTFFEQLAINVSEGSCGRYVVEKVTEWLLQHDESDLLLLVENPAARIARFIDGLNLMTGSIARDAISHYINAGRLKSEVLQLLPETEDAHSPSTSQSQLLKHLCSYFHHFTVDRASGDLTPCVSEKDAEFQKADFRIYLVDDFGSLHSLLYQLGRLKQSAADGAPPAIGVDFEGVRLSRHGAMTLAQFCMSCDPRSVYTVDVARLQGHAFHIPTHTGCSLKTILEDPQIRKICFDPRHDSDALFHQFRVVVNGAFDLQLAEVALRRARGLAVRYVQGLFKCLNSQPDVLSEPQKYLAEKINDIGKSLFEPEHGGDYEILRARPLHPSILIYASHDARFLLSLYNQFVTQLAVSEGGWLERVAHASAERARWYLHEEYRLPTTDAPDF